MCGRDRLRVMCLLDSDVYRALERGGRRTGRSRGNESVVRALRQLYSDVLLQPAGRPDAALDSIARHRPDVLFNLAFSGMVEEAAFTARLETCGIPFTGSGSVALALTNDKVRTRRVLKRHGIRVPRCVELPVGKRRSLAQLTPPLLLKPSICGGSSFGIHADSVVVSRREAMARAARLWKRFGDAAVCDEFIVGREFRVGAVEVGRTGSFRPVNVSESLFPRANPGWGIKTQAIRSNDRVRSAQGVRSSLLDSASREWRSLAALAEPVARACQLCGYLTLDVRADSRDRYFVVDVNGNPHLSAGVGIWSYPAFDGNLRQLVESALAYGNRRQA